MDVAGILTTLRATGLTLTVEGGHIRITPKSALTDDMRELIREHKPKIIRALSAPTIPLTAPDELSILRWLAHIQETDQDLIAYTLEQCRTNPDKRAYFLKRSEEAHAVVAEVGPITPGCMRCLHRRHGRIGECSGCVARPDLPPLYGEGHPLRMLPEDGGVDCRKFERTVRRRATCH
jgi:TubC N-terminal docking domain